MIELTGEEAFELLIKYAGEVGISKIKEMIHMVGVEKTLVNIERSYNNSGQKVTEEFMTWMRTAVSHLHETTKNSN